MSVNKVILVGNVGQDPTIRTFKSGEMGGQFSLATTETYIKNGEKVSNTEWHTIVVWRKLAEIVEKYVRKGNMLYVEGKLKTRKWTDKNGVERYSTDIVADTIRMLGSKNTETSEKSKQAVSDYAKPETKTQQPDDVPASDDLPF
jgi:single-strand DNA-binding protein